LETHKINFFLCVFSFCPPLTTFQNVSHIRDVVCLSYESRAIKGHVLWSTAACWTTRCVKELMSFHPVAFRHIPSDVTASKLCQGLKSGNSLWICVYKIYCGLISVRKLETFDYVVGVFLSKKLSLFLRILNSSHKESTTLSFSDHSLEGRCSRCCPGEWRVEKKSERFWEKVCGV
jgi:hypothetical protein